LLNQNRTAEIQLWLHSYQVMHTQLHHRWCRD
jgi:hypothetical protein